MPRTAFFHKSSRSRVNTRFFLRSMFVLALMASVFSFAYWVQIGRVASSLKAQSLVAEQAEEYERAAELLNRYLSLKPEDTKELVHSLSLREKNSNNPQILRGVISFGFRVLGTLRAQSPNDPEEITRVQKTLVDLLLKRGSFEGPGQRVATFAEAQSLLLEMAATIPKDDHLWLREKLSLCLFSTRPSPEALSKKGGVMNRAGTWADSFVDQSPLQAMTSVLEEGSTDLDLLDCVARILINPEAINYTWDDAALKLPVSKRLQILQSFFERAANDHTESSRFFSSRAIANSSLNPKQAESDFRKAIELDPENLNLMKTTASFFFQRYLDGQRLAVENEAEMARKECWKYVDLANRLAPDVDADLVMLQGQLFATEGNYDDAISILSKLANRADEQGIASRMAVAELLTRQGKYSELLEWTKETDNLLDKAKFDSRARRNDLSLVNDRQKATVLIRSGKFREALTLLKQMEQQSTKKETNLLDELMLGDCYYALGDFSSAEQHMEIALKLMPEDESLLRKLAAVKVALFRPSEAGDAIRRITSKTMEDWLLLSKCIYLVKTTDRDGEGTVQDLEQSLQFAREASVDQKPSPQFMWNLELFELLAKGLRDDANRISRDQIGLGLIDLIERYPGEEQLANSAISILMQENMKELAEQAQQIAIEQNPNSWLAVSQSVDKALNGKQTTEAFEILYRFLAQKPDEPAAWSSIIRLHGLEGVPASGGPAIWEFLPKVSGIQFNSIVRQWMRLPFDLPLSQKAFEDWTSKTNWLIDYIAEHPDSTPPWGNVLKTSIAIGVAERATSSEPLETMVAECKKEHGSLPEVNLLAARLALIQNKPSDAVVHLREVERAGLATDRVAEAILASLLQTGRTAEANIYLRELGESVYRSGRLAQLAITMASPEQGNRLEIARKAALVRPSDPISWITLTNLLIFEAKNYPLDQRKTWTDQAMDALVKAKAIRPLDPVIEKAFLFDIATTLGDFDNAKEVLKQLEQTDSNPPLAKNLAIASMHETLGQLTEGIAVLEATRAEYPDDNRLLENLSKLYHATNQVEPLIQILGIQLAKDPKNANLRRRYATQLAFRGLPEDWERAEKLLESNGKEDAEFDTRIKVQLLLSRGRESDLTRAQALMEDLLRKSNTPSADDRIALAQIYQRSLRVYLSRNSDQEKIKNLRESAYDLIQKAVAIPSPDMRHLSLAVRFCLDNGILQEAKNFTSKMESVAANSYEAADARARILSYENSRDLASQEIDRWVALETARTSDKLNRADVFKKASLSFKSMEIFDKALEYAKKAYDESPDNGLHLISIAGDPKNQEPRNDLIAKLKTRAEGTRSPIDAILLGDLLSASPPNTLELESFEPLFLDIIKAHPEDLRLQFTLANIYLSRGMTSNASGLYRAILEKNPANSAALNNLANILLEDPTSVEEALSCIEKALFQEPGNALMLDTKGSILVKMGKASEAIQVFEAALAMSKDPRIGLHLFDALNRAGQHEEAKNFSRKVAVEELGRSLLSPDDLKILDTLKKSP